MPDSRLLTVVADLRLRSTERLQKPRQFSQVYQNNQVRLGGQYFMVLAFYCASQKKLGVVASKKVSKKAVIRNKMKRLMREAYRHSNVLGDFHYVMIAKVGADKAENLALIHDLNTTLARVRKKCEYYLSQQLSATNGC